MTNATKNVGVVISRAGRATILILGLFSVGCTFNIPVQSLPNFSNTHPEKIKSKALLIISDSLSNYVYRGTGSTPVYVYPGPLSDTWVFPLGQSTSDLLRKGVPLIFEDVEVAAESPPGNDPKAPTFALILKPSIESLDFGLGPPSWVRIKYKVEVSDSNGKVVFHKIVTGRGESKRHFDFAGTAALAKAADDAVQTGVNLLLDSLSRMSIEPKLVR